MNSQPADAPRRSPRRAGHPRRRGDAGPLRAEPPIDPTAAVVAHLREQIERAGYDLATLSRDTLGRAPDYLSKMLRGERIFRLADLFALLAAIDVAPVDFFAELYDLYRPDQLGAEISPGIYEGQLRRLVRQVARRAALEVTAGKGRAAKRRAGRPPRPSPRARRESD